jgi:hypothetical protein
VPVGGGRRVLAQRGRLPPDAFRQRLDELDQGGTDQVVGGSRVPRRIR